MSERYRAWKIPADWLEVCNECGALVGDRAAHDVFAHHAPSPAQGAGAEEAEGRG